MKPLMFFFTGIWPIRTTQLGGVAEAAAGRRAAWLQRVRRLGRDGR